MGIHACTHAEETTPSRSLFMSLTKNSSNFSLPLTVWCLRISIPSLAFQLPCSLCLSIYFLHVYQSPTQSPSPLSLCKRWAERVHPGPCLGGVGLQCGDFPLAESQHGRGNAIRAGLRTSQGTHGPDHGPVIRYRGRIYRPGPGADITDIRDPVYAYETRAGDRTLITQLVSHFLSTIMEFHQLRSDIRDQNLNWSTFGCRALCPNRQLTRKLHSRGACSHLVTAHVYGRPNRAFTIQLHR